MKESHGPSTNGLTGNWGTSFQVRHICGGKTTRSASNLIVGAIFSLNHSLGMSQVSQMGRLRELFIEDRDTQNGLKQSQNVLPHKRRRNTVGKIEFEHLTEGGKTKANFLEKEPDWKFLGSDRPKNLIIGLFQLPAKTWKEILWQKRFQSTFKH